MAHSAASEQSDSHWYLGSHSHLTYTTARILNVISDQTFMPEAEGLVEVEDPLQGLRRGTILYEVEILRGSFSGEVLEATYHINSLAHVHFDIGDRVSVRIFEFEGEFMVVEVRYPERTELLLGAIGLFLIFLCLIGGKRGMLAAMGLVFTVVCVIFLLIPLIIAGFPVVQMTLIVLMLVTFSTVTLLAGLSVKSMAAILGTLSGIGLAALFAHLTGNLIHVSGYNMGNYRAIMHLSDGAQISGLFVSSVLVAAIGAIMDASMSVASAMGEVKSAHGNISAIALFKAGFNVSRDVIGTMSSTLILAFIGGSLSMMIFIYTTDVSLNQFMNNPFIAMEIVKGIAGSFGIMLAAPLTAVISAKLLTMKKCYSE
ncbi:MAG: YibE/F family protein [Defluviitaleaceae bacterium]|nr:YibE/F family protein [Defluviitaleaceae bacterium]